MKAAVERIGDPQNAITTTGPPVVRATSQRVLELIERSRDEAELVAAEVHRGDRGYFMELTVYTDTHQTPEAFFPLKGTCISIFVCEGISLQAVI